MQLAKVDITGLKTVKNYAASNSVTTAYIYKLIKASKLEAVTIDGVIFIDAVKYPTIRNSK
ncbi:hypothetical protein MUY27_06670 [Mucilaginibacter sp. RS28]|uniref:Uncharacterized protein n=1 Tax=Mucilaginibacter straminoryzae TaxID=2932774 RepID=A0A9X2B8E7_9SPHI|nr:hypothetical protein [Mucilaginibacter straminoryzae]MCJ8209386.1 hypothetical protein [Mucilaginibacter straminoryzae]